MSQMLPFVVYALPNDLASAKRELGWLPEAKMLSVTSVDNTLPESRISIVYVRSAPTPDYRTVIQRFRIRQGAIQSTVHQAGQKSDVVAFYTPAPQTAPEAFEWGKLCGEITHSFLVEGKAHLQQVLCTYGGWQRPASELKMTDARKRLVLTQQEMAAVIGVTDRTIQNWETGQNLSQMAKKTQKLRRLLQLMDEFVVVPKEREWLLTKLPALGGKTPKEVIVAGKMDDLILELSRLEEGVPV